MLYALVHFYTAACDGTRPHKRHRKRKSELRANFSDRNPDIFSDVLWWYNGNALRITPGFSLGTILCEWDFWGVDPVNDISVMHLAVLPASWNTTERIRERLAHLADSIAALAREMPHILHDGQILVLPTEGWFTFVNISPTYMDDISALHHEFVRQLLILQLCRSHIHARFVTHPPTCIRLHGQKRWTYAILQHWVVGDDSAHEKSATALRSMTATECARCNMKCTETSSGCWRSEERTKRATLCMDIRMTSCIDDVTS